MEGQRNTYAGGGYMIKFEKDLVLSHQMIDELERTLWIDRRTRAVFVEFTLYNPNVNLFFNGIYLLEFPDSAGVVTWVNLQVFRPFQALRRHWNIRPPLLFHLYHFLLDIKRSNDLPNLQTKVSLF